MLNFGATGIGNGTAYNTLIKDRDVMIMKQSRAAAMNSILNRRYPAIAILDAKEKQL
jgi:hypothetical protein